MLRRVRVLPVVLLTFTCWLACNEYELAEEEAEIIVQPDSLDFGYVTTGAATNQEFRIKNVGDKSVEITGFAWGEDVPYLGMDHVLDEPFNLEDGRNEPVTVYFSPTDDMAETTNQVLVYHDAAEEPEVVELLMAAGAEPDIDAEPASVEFGAVNSNQTLTEQVVLTNVGEGFLQIDELIVSGDPEFSVSNGDAVGSSLESGQSASFDVHFNAGGQSGGFVGQVDVLSNDPDENPLIIPLSAGSGVPVAYCHADPEEVYAISESSTFYPDDGAGNASSDPNYGANDLNYNWTWVSKPQGSAVNMVGNGQTRTVTPDMVGTYTAQLVVCNPLEECSAPCTASFDALAADNLWVELSWNTPSDDMDLHLLKPGGNYQSNGDCYYANCQQNNIYHTLNWGQPNNYDDDPSLDLDDIPGTGPENINVDVPEQGTFTIIVHDYEGSNGWGGDFQGGNVVTVNVYTNGNMEYTETLTISGDNTVNYIATCTFPGGDCYPM